MNTYALAKLIEAAGGVDSRKRLQKAVYLIQLAGHDLEARYFLHFYGPYSRDVAEATDMLAQCGILKETAELLPWGEQYAYEVDDEGQKKLDAVSKDQDETSNEGLNEAIEKFRQLKTVDRWQLELAATVAYYRDNDCSDWDEAVAKTAEFKRVAADAGVLSDALDLAQKYYSAA